MRQLVSYDDIASRVTAKADSLPNCGSGSAPKKRRKNNHRQGQRWSSHRSQFRDDDREDEDETPPRKTRTDYGIEEESRQLTHEEVWDDSALIHAWDAAIEEYEVLNGPEKKWKSEPVTKSPLWFNIPPETVMPTESSPGPSFPMPSIPAVFTSEGDVEQGEEDIESLDPDNSHPVDFDTFIPRHDPSLSDVKHGIAGNLGNATSARHGIVPPAPAEMNTQVTPNDAFERAMGAWYWAGYWTGVYHSNSKKGLQKSDQLETVDDDMVGNVEREDQEAPNEQVEDTDLIPT